MAIPSEYQDNAGSVGSTDIKHPIISFRIINSRQKEESIGPITNLKSGQVLHPNMHQTSPDKGRSDTELNEAYISNHKFISGLLGAENIAGDGSFTAYGQKAVYLKNAFADVPNPILVVTNQPPYTSA